MRITNIRAQNSGSQTTLIADIYPRGKKTPFNLWFKVDSKYESLLSKNGDAFVAALLIECMWENESIEVDALVSKLLLSNIDELMAYYAIGDPTLTPIKIKAKGVVSKSKGDLVGCFFSGGVDSFFTFLKNIEKYSHNRGRISHFFLVRGFDISLNEKQDWLWEITQNNISKIAKQYGIKLITVETNIREYTQQPADWKKKEIKEFWAISQHGSSMCSVGLAFQGSFSQIYIPATHGYYKLLPWGSHPLTDPLWSTENMTFIHYGCWTGRPEKLNTVIKSSIALKTLRVCWDNKDNKYNCGKCEKCIRTMVALDILGVLDKMESFKGKVDDEALANVDLITVVDKDHWEELARGAEKLGKTKYAKKIRKFIHG